MKRSALLLTAWLACIPTALSWEPIAGSRPTWEGSSVTYELERSGSDDLGSATEGEVTEAMGSWGQVACTGLRVVYGGLTDDAPSSVDGRFVLGFVESGWREGSGVLGVTATRYNGSRLIEADIAFNGDDWTWSTGQGDIRSRTCNAATIIGHEGGHFFGIGHSGDSSALMNASYSGGITAIGPDDQEAICSLYPGTPQPPPHLRDRRMPGR